MGNRDFERKIEHALHQPTTVPDARRLEAALLLAQNEAVRKTHRKRISFAQFLLGQIKFIGWKIWMMQGVFLLITRYLLTRSFWAYHLENPKSIPKLLFCLSVFVLMTALPFIYRSLRFQMQEIESAARFSSKKLLMAKLAIIGAGDIAVLGGILLTTIAKTSLRAGIAGLYLSFPFLLAGSICLYMLGHCALRLFFPGSMSLCFILITAFLTVCKHYEPLLEQSFSSGWIGVYALLTVFCAYQLHYIMHDSPYAEMQLTR